MSRGNLDHSGIYWSMSGIHYQYITTGPVFTQGATFGSSAQGSAVAVKLPKVKAGEEVSLSDLKVQATGSSLEVRPGTSEIQPASELGILTRVKNVNQVSLIPEPVYHAYADLSKPENYTQLMYAWCSRPGMIFNAGAYMLAPWKGLRDIGYDAPPTVIRGQSVAERMPDADWPHDACLVKVESEVYGARIFIVMVDASSRFYCWPTQYDSNEWIENPTYAAQAYKNNVPNEQVQSLVPPFPAWVYVPVDQRRDTDWPGSVISGEPRYVWRFHPQGTKVVGIVLKREEFTGRIWGRTLSAPTYLPFTEVDTGEDLELDLSSRAIDYEGVPKSDWPGYVEFSLDIAITGVNKEDFTFGMSLTRNQEASATLYPIAADYLQPIQGGWAARGISGYPGDLIVMDLQSYIDERSQTWIARHCGYKGTTSEKVRQSWLSVRNEETSAELMKFLTKDLPTDFQYKQYHLDCADLRAYHGRLSHIDLANLSFVYEAWVEKFDVDATAYKTVVGTTYNSGYDDFKVRQRWKSSEHGVRYFVFGHKVKEDHNGEDLDLWTALDAIELFDYSIQFSPLETGTRWLRNPSTKQYPLSYDFHWLTPYIGYIGYDSLTDNPPAPATYGKYNPATYNTYVLSPLYGSSSRYVETDEAVIKQRLLSRLVQYSEVYDEFSEGLDDVTGTRYYINGLKDVTITLSGEWSTVWGGPPGTEERDVTISVMLLEEAAGLPRYTGIIDLLVAGCQTATRSWYDTVFTDWFLEEYNAFISHVDITNTENEHTAIYYTYPAGGILDGRLIEPAHEYEYLLEDGTMDRRFMEDYISYTKTYSSTESGYYVPSQITPTSMMFKNDNLEYADEESLRTTYSTLSNRNLRIYDYPIGAEWMMREWHEATFNDMNLHLAVSPEGYYAGAMQFPYCLAPIPEHSVFSYYPKISGTNVDYYKELHFVNTSVNYINSAYVYLPYAHFSHADRMFSTVNQPSASSFDFGAIDEIGHIDSTSKTSHAALYATAYEHSLTIPAPDVTVTYPSDVYTYNKVITWSGGDETSPLFNDKPSIYKPFPNGSMLFSK